MKEDVTVICGTLNRTTSIITNYMANSRFAPSQWETALLCNDISHWLGANLESALNYIRSDLIFSVLWMTVLRKYLPWETCVIIIWVMDDYLCLTPIASFNLIEKNYPEHGLVITSHSDMHDLIAHPCLRSIFLACKFSNKSFTKFVWWLSSTLLTLQCQLLCSRSTFLLTLTP